MRWKKLVSKKVWQELQDLKPDSIEFKVLDNCYTICTIKKKNKEGIGVSICSVLDKFNPRVGVNKAIGRAIKALKKESSSDFVRTHWNDFPKSWRIRQAERVMGCPIFVKSLFKEIVGS